VPRCRSAALRRELVGVKQLQVFGWQAIQREKIGYQIHLAVFQITRNFLVHQLEPAIISVILRSNRSHTASL
jgi:hypothetical protein